MAASRQLYRLPGAHLGVHVILHATHLLHEGDDINAERSRTDEEQ